MKQYVSLDKRSKKAQKEFYSKQRHTWGVLNPATRSVPSGKIYNRKKDKQERRRIGKEFSDGFDADFLSPCIRRGLLVVGFVSVASFYTTSTMTFSNVAYKIIRDNIIMEGTL